MTDETTTTAPMGESVDISVNDTKAPERTFIGEIVVDAIEPAKVFEGSGGSGYQEHLAVKPLSFSLRSQTGAFHCWPAIKYGKDGGLVKTGEFGRVTGAIREVFRKELTQRGMELRKLAVAQATLDGEDTTELARKDPMDFVKVGKGHFLGLQGEFVMRTLEYGKTKAGETIRGGRDSIIALRSAKPEDVATAQAQLTGVATPADLSYSDEQIEQLVNVMDGKNPGQYMRGLGRSGLSNEVVGAVTNGKGLEYLVANNRVTVDADGTVRRVNA